MANLFGKNYLREKAKQINTKDIQEYIDIVLTWHNDYHHGTLKTDKETSREQQYNRDFFLTILGYKEKPATPYSFEPKATTEKGQLPDAVISYTDKSKDIKNISAVVELKGASVPLDRPQRREGNMSPIQQGFKYKTQYRNCPFVVVSNFWEFRLYNDTQLDFEIWTLDDLVNPADDYILFKTWFVLLSKDNFVSKQGKSTTESLLSDIRVVQEDIGKKFYKVYKQVRLELLRDIYKNNHFIKKDIDTGIEKAQKIIDRIVFAAFAEDKNLLPDDTLQKVLRAADHSVFGGSLWNTFKSFFEAIDGGSDKLDIPSGYNGGLFARDEVLNNLEISDEPLRAVAELGSYNFSEDLSVNILGHIFEQSISDLEEIKNKVKESQNIETLSQSRRKKDGIFYTPDYIVHYIVDNSLGTYLREEEERLKKEFKLHGDINDKTYDRREKQAYAKYYEFLKGIKVVDPACGSGAFLVYVFDYLLAEHERVGAILGLNKAIVSFEDVYKNILQNNIYGVDLNEESVEITKLSLWLKSAQKGKKLTALDNNIRCGNSLIDDEKVAGKKAFNWQKEFADIFENGGFDVVVGNPPYVKEYTAKSAFEGLHSNPIYQGKMDLWYFFGALALDIIKPSKGLIGYIAPSNWITNSGAQKFRDKVLADGKIIQFIDFGDFKVFDQAGIQTMIYIMKRENASEYNFDYSKVANSKINHEAAKAFLAKVDDPRFDYYSAKVNRALSQNKTLNFNHQTNGDLLNKIESIGTIRLFDSEVAQGIVAPQDYVNKKTAALLGDAASVGNGIFNLSNTEYEKLGLSQTEKQLVKPFYTTEQLHRYYGNQQNTSWIIYTDSKFKNPDEMQPYPNLKQHLDTYMPVITSSNKPYGLHRARDEKFFIGEKIISLRKTHRPSFTFTNFDAYVSQTYFVIKTVRADMRYLTAILNSKVISFWLRYKGKMQGDIYQIDKAPLLEIPLVVHEDQSILANLTVKMIDYLEKLNDINQHFYKLLLSEFEIVIESTKLNNWWWLGFSDFIKILKVDLSLTQKDELLSLFEKYKSQCAEIDEKIQKTDQEIDQLVYKLYKLTPEEISIIEKEGSA